MFLAHLLACSTETASTEAVTLSLQLDAAQLDLGQVSYADAPPSAALEIVQDSGGSITVHAFEVEGRGANLITLTGAPEAGAELGDGRALTLVVGVTEELEQWATGFYQPILVLSGCDTEKNGSSCPAHAVQSVEVPLYLSVRCDLDADGFDDLACGGTDCADDDASISPGAEDTCNSFDDDCDGQRDEDGDHTYCLDADGDGYGVEDETIGGCDTAPSGYAAELGDCDDDDASVNPGAVDECGDEADDIDQDCNGVADNVDLVNTWYGDADGDGYGDESVELLSCQTSPPSGYAEYAGVYDCDDEAGDVSPASEEICDDGIDNDCSGTADCADSACRTELPCGLDVVDADASWEGDSALWEAGATLASLGDVDGDGADEFVIAAPGADGGQVFLLSGDAGSGALSAAGSAWTAEGEADLAGSSLASAGDVDGDGLPDLLVGAQGSSVAYLLTDPVGGGSLADAWAIVRGSDQLGSAVSTAGDMDGDGLGEFVVGAAGYDGTGAAFVFTGGSSGELSVGDAHALVGEADDDLAGATLGGGHDLDGDGYGDLVVGAPGHDAEGTDAGVLYVVRGPVTGGVELVDALRVRGAASYDELSVFSLGDADGDGQADLLIGTPGDDSPDTDSGAVYLGTGPLTEDLGLDDLRRLAGQAAAEGAGTSVAFLGDLDGDGAEEMLAGAPGGATAEGLTGVAYFFDDPFTHTNLNDEALVITGDGVNGHFGSAVSAAGDVDGDGTPDLLMGAPNHNAHGAGSGATYLVLGDRL